MGLRAYIRRGSPQPVAPARLVVPAPNGSINTIAGGAQFPPEDCIVRDNLIPGEFGVRTRLGSREWALVGGEQVRTLMPFTGSTALGTNDRLFAATSSGIWDVTASSPAATRVVDFPDVSEDSGWGACAAFVNADGNHFLAYTDEANGYYVFSEVGGTWAKVTQGAGGTQIANVDPSLFASVLSWKNRLWFVERGSARAWYLPVGAIYGAATAFNFGRRFPHGGELRALGSWSFDAGQGIDDQLVAVSGGGDVVIYVGTDPSSEQTFGIRAFWYAGGVPLGRRLMTDNGGDLLLMTSTGIVPLSRLTTGVNLLAPSQFDTYKVSSLFNSLQTRHRNARGWSMVMHPQDAVLIVLIPSSSPKPIVMSLWNKGWSTYSGMPIGKCAAPWNGTLYFGTDDGRVMVNDGDVDGVTLADPNSFAAVPWSLLTGFHKLGDPRQKQVTMIRPTFVSEGDDPRYAVEARYAWDRSEIAAASIPAETVGPNDWNEGEWNVAEWASGTERSVRGAVGMGPEVAFALRGEATSRVTLVDLDVEFTVGGFL
jgi:hypothetical protein